MPVSRPVNKGCSVQLEHVFSPVVFKTEIVVLNSYRFVKFSKRQIRLRNKVSSLIRRLVLSHKYMPDIVGFYQNIA